jgi:hypothetical protein
MAIVSIAQLKTYFERKDLPTQQQFIDLIDTLGGGGAYKRYVANINQSGANDPVATVLENTLGGTVVWTRFSGGYYLGTLTGAFPAGKTILFPTITTGYSGPSPIGLGRTNDNQVYLIAAGDAQWGGTGTGMGIEIRVYIA